MDLSTLKSKKSTVEPDSNLGGFGPLEITVLTGTATGNNGEPVKTELRIYPDKSKNLSTSTTLNVTTPQGVPEKVTVVSTQSYSPSNIPLGHPVIQSSSTSSNTALSSDYSLAPNSGGNGQTLAQQGGITPAVTGSGSGSGGCTSGDCSTESTQLANKGLLQSILDALTGGVSPDDPQAKSGADISDAISASYGGPLSGLKGWQLPAHVSQCPSGSFTIPGSSHVFSMDGHCAFANNNLPLLSSIFLVIWNLAALMIVIRL